MKQIALLSAVLFSIGFLSSCQKESLPSAVAGSAAGLSADSRGSGQPTPENWFFCNAKLVVNKVFDASGKQYLYAYGADGSLAYDGVEIPRTEANVLNGIPVELTSVTAIWATISTPSGGLYIVETSGNKIILMNSGWKAICSGVKM